MTRLWFSLKPHTAVFTSNQTSFTRLIIMLSKESQNTKKKKKSQLLQVYFAKNSFSLHCTLPICSLELFDCNFHHPHSS